MLRFAWTLICCLVGVYSIGYTLPQPYSIFLNGHSPRLGGRNSLFESNIPSLGFGDHSFEQSDFAGAHFGGSNLGGSNFGGANFGGSNFGGSNFGGSNFGGGNFGGNPPQPNPGCATAPAGPCQKARYRTYDGTCNNLRNPVLGTPNSRYTRLLGPKYGDGISTPTMSVLGNPLPGARLVSIALYPDVPVQDHIWTLIAMQYGQIITHDMSMITGSTQTKPHSTQCCSPDGQLLEGSNIPEHCYPIVIPKGDPLLAKYNVNCMNFVRTITDRDRNCVGGQQPAEQLTAVNNFLDLSIVYGNTQDVNIQLRTFQGGRMRTEERYGMEWPPSNNNKTGACAVQSEDEPCYMAGDLRVNQNPQLTILQIILLKEHNRVADILGKLNPQWSDETIFQEARRICIAEHQFISYYEWLPIFIGLQNSYQNKIIYTTKDYVNDYNENVNPTILNEHATAAFRFFHSLIAGFLDLVPEHRHVYGNIRLSDWFNRPLVLEQENNFDDLTRGMCTQPQLASDQYHDSEITQFLFKNNSQFGFDLKAIDIQRNRDHGLASYNDYRQFCGLSKAFSFHDFLDVISGENVEKLARLYESPDDVDLTVGGSLEKVIPGTLAGPTFLCILTEQFYRTRAGDRYWFENGYSGAPFTIEQLNEIRKSSISRLLCDNANHVESMQPRGFEKISEHNSVLPCQSLPAVDLSLWRDVAFDKGANSHLLY
ncbi:Peroxidase [Carabus blaptoides fortunei]